MTIVFAALLGLLAGWLLNYLSDALPYHLAKTPRAIERKPDNASSFIAKHASRIVAAVTALYFGLTFAHFGFTSAWLLSISSFAFFMLVALIDLKYRLVLNFMTYPAIVLLLIIHLLVLRQHSLNIILGGVMAFGIFFLVASLRPGQLGGGDVKLAALIGVAFGFPNVLWALMIAAITSGVFIAYMLFIRHSTLRARIPYAPFLCIGAMSVALITLLI
jgi:prepilin signal peptidase PulO-like enzyme (type II secretory pathway)